MLDMHNVEQQQREAEEEEQHIEPEIHYPRPIGPTEHMCIWRQMYLDLAAKMRELEVEVENHPTLIPETIESPGAVSDRGSDMADIQGLTILLHREGRPDLVIRTEVQQR